MSFRLDSRIKPTFRRAAGIWLTICACRDLVGVKLATKYHSAVIDSEPDFANAVATATGLTAAKLKALTAI